MKQSSNVALTIILAVLATSNVWGGILYQRAVTKQENQEKAISCLQREVVILQNRREVQPGEIQTIVRAEINSLELRLYKDGLIRYNPSKTH